MISISQRPSLSVESLSNKAFKLNSVFCSDDTYTPGFAALDFANGVGSQGGRIMSIRLVYSQ